MFIQHYYIMIVYVYIIILDVHACRFITRWICLRDTMTFWDDWYLFFQQLARLVSVDRSIDHGWVGGSCPFVPQYQLLQDFSEPLIFIAAMFGSYYDRWRGIQFFKYSKWLPLHGDTITKSYGPFVSPGCIIGVSLSILKAIHFSHSLSLSLSVSLPPSSLFSSLSLTSHRSVFYAFIFGCSKGSRLKGVSEIMVVVLFQIWGPFFQRWLPDSIQALPFHLSL